MATASRPDRRVVLVAARDAAAATRALAEVFGIEERLAESIVRAAPIVLVERLTEEQARAVDGVLAPLRHAGARIEVRGEEASALAKVGWPGAIRIGGKAIEDLAAQEFTFTCPTCGEVFVIRRRAAELPDVPKVAREARPTLRESGLEEIPLPEEMQALSTERAQPVAAGSNAAPAAAAPPPQAPAPAATSAAFGGAVPAAMASPSASGPMALEDFEAGLADLEDEDPLAELDRALPSAAPVAASPASPPPRRAPAAPAPAAAGHGGEEEVSLDDLEGDGITVLPDEPPPPRSKAQPVRPMSPQQAARASKAKKAGAAKAGSGKGPAAEGGGVCSVYTSKTNSEKVHQLMAEVMGISLEEAADLAQKALVPIAKDVSAAAAEAIRKKFVAKKVSVRIMKKRQ